MDRECRLSGVIETAECSIKGKLAEKFPLTGKMPNTTVINMEAAPEYKGPTEVTPSTEVRILDTDGKKVTEDIIVHPIPFFSVSNQAGGNTIVIGG